MHAGFSLNPVGRFDLKCVVCWLPGVLYIVCDSLALVVADRGAHDGAKLECFQRGRVAVLEPAVAVPKQLVPLCAIFLNQIKSDQIKSNK